MASILLNRRASQPISPAASHMKARGSLVPNLPPQGEDSEMAEHDDEKIEDPINDEVSKNSLAVPDIRNKARFWRRKQSCHM
ncbi:hypothetical protein EB796_003752 [Bugula neritina]|uniref:Uncharacterized protein n=1 Tax=Bugula neritina TaxID=10212 RepID=A0A7J7KGZ9_BUGNE|nr:hypothetical protein EB796_003752 [Bugula neritina]